MQQQPTMVKRTKRIQGLPPTQPSLPVSNTSQVIIQPWGRYPGIVGNPYERGDCILFPGHSMLPIQFYPVARKSVTGSPDARKPKQVPAPSNHAAGIVRASSAPNIKTAPMVSLTSSPIMMRSQPTSASISRTSSSSRMQNAMATAFASSIVPLQSWFSPPPPLPPRPPQYAK